jgi:hypothetical protein
MRKRTTRRIYTRTLFFAIVLLVSHNGFAQSKIRFHSYPINGPVAERLTKIYSNVEDTLDYFNNVVPSLAAVRESYSDGRIIKKEFLKDSEGIFEGNKAEILFDYSSNGKLKNVKEFVLLAGDELELKSDIELFYSDELLDYEIEKDYRNESKKFIYRKELQTINPPIYTCNHALNEYSVQFGEQSRLSSYHIANNDTLMSRSSLVIDENSWSEIIEMNHQSNKRIISSQTNIIKRDRFGNPLVEVSEQNNGKYNILEHSYKYKQKGVEKVDESLSIDQLNGNWINNSKNLLVKINTISSSEGTLNLSAIDSDKLMVEEVIWYNNLKNGRNYKFDFQKNEDNFYELQIIDADYRIEIIYKDEKIALSCDGVPLHLYRN